MLLILLKSSICLAVFMLFYKLCLEKTSVHNFKRFYLIAVILISIGIPFITFTEYIEVNIEPENFEVLAHQNDSISQNFEIAETKKIQDYLTSILWVVYGIGFILFAYRFFKNLYQLINKIKQNPKYKHQSFIHVLIQDLIIPHTFLNYIFLNKKSFKNKVIPQEVLLHEQAHAKQKHSLDILFIETLQILFWFNPLLYFIKKDIKLNHEFLADQVVLNNGFNSKNYQQLLLAFSSNASHSSLANAINYSLIKKRFTVMKTQTSKQAFWLRSLILLPLLAFLIYSFSNKVLIENPIKQTTLNIANTIEIKIFIDKNKNVFIDNKGIDFDELSQELIALKNNLVKQSSTVPKLNIEIEAHVTDEYFDEIKNEIIKTNLKVSKFQSYSLLLDKNKSDPYFKGTKFTAEYLVFENKKGEITEGISIPENTTYSQSENLKSLLKYLKEKNFTKSLNEAKNQKEKIEIKKNKDFIKSRIEMVLKKLNSKPKTTQKGIGKKSNPLVIKIIDNETISINKKKCPLIDFEKKIINLVDNLSTKEKEGLTLIIVYNPGNPGTDETMMGLKNILRKHNILRVNLKTEIIFSKETDTIYIINKEKATPEQILEYNKLAKKINSNPEGIFKAKDIKRVIALYNLMSKEQREEAEPLPKFVPPPPIPKNATPEEIETHKKRYEKYNILTKD